MLSKILSKETCRECKFCCRFKKESLWETPLFSFSQKENLKNKYPSSVFKNINDVFTIDLDSSYQTKNSCEQASCFFLNSKNGCILNKNEKPFDCSIWPFRLMQTEKNLVIALTPTCPAINKISLDEIKKFVIEDLAKKIFDYGKMHSFIIKKYRKDFPIIVTEEDFLKRNKNLLES